MRATSSIIRVACLAFVLTSASGLARAEDPVAPLPSVTPGQSAWEFARAAFWAGDPGASKLLAEVAASPTAPALIRRDASHLLGRLLSGDQPRSAIASRPPTDEAPPTTRRPIEAVVAWRNALDLTSEAPSHLTDLIRFGLARALVDSGSREEEPLVLLAAIDKSPYSPVRADAAFLRARQFEKLGRLDEAKKAYSSVLDRWPDAVFARDVKVRLGALDVADGRGDHARDVLAEIALEAPHSAPGREAELLLASIGSNAPQRLDLGHDAARVPLSYIAFLIRERRFDQVGPALAPWLVEPPPGSEKGAVDAWLDAMELALDDHWENFRFDDALAVNERLRKNKRPGLSKARETRLYALDGDFDKARAELKKRLRGKSYFAALGDLAFEFARYDEAYDAYLKAFGKRTKESPTERMVWCLMRMGKPERAAKYWERLGKTRGFNKNLYERYWYARAQQLANKPAKALFEALVEDAPLEYYGLQAWSRIQELDGTVPPMVTPPTLAVPRKGDEPLVGNPTVAWTEASLAGAFDRAPQAAQIGDIAPLISAFAGRWGHTAEEANRAAELVGLGDLAGATSELRVIDMDMRSLRNSGAALGNRARSDLLDNRGSPRARGGATMRETGIARKSGEQVSAMKRGAGEIRKGLRALQIALADPYGMRRGVLEDQWNVTPQLLADKGTSLYPIAYPEVVKPLTEQFGLPPYYVYAVMTVESAFHPGAVSVSSAYGLVQVIPRTGENLARELGYLDFTPERLLDPSVSIYFGGYYLARLLSRFHGQETLAAAAYNAGPHRVATWLMARGRIPMDMFIEDIPYDQARGYTKTVCEHIAAYRRIYHGEDHVYLRNTIDSTMGDGPNY